MQTDSRYLRSFGKLSHIYCVQVGWILFCPSKILVSSSSDPFNLYAASVAIKRWFANSAVIAPALGFQRQLSHLFGISITRFLTFQERRTNSLEPFYHIVTCRFISCWPKDSSDSTVLPVVLLISVSVVSISFRSLTCTNNLSPDTGLLHYQYYTNPWI